MKKKLKEELKDKLDFNDEIQKDEKKPIVLKSKDKVKENFRSIFYAILAALVIRSFFYEFMI